MGTLAPLLRLALVCVLAAVSSAAWSKPPAEGAREAQAKVDKQSAQNEYAAANAKSQSNSIFITEYATRPENSDAETKAEAYRREKSSANEDSVALWTAKLGRYTLFLVIIAVIQAALFAWQLSMMRNSLADVEKSAQAAHASAEATKRIADATKDNSERSLRAYLGVRRHKILKDVNSNYLVGRLLIRNFGSTPAKNVRSKVSLNVLDRWPKTSEIPASVADDAARSYLPPNSDTNIQGWLTFDFHGPTSASVFGNTTSKSMKLYVVALVLYEDIHGNSQSLTFSSRVQWKEGSDDHIWIPDARHNKGT